MEEEKEVYRDLQLSDIIHEYLADNIDREELNKHFERETEDIIMSAIDIVETQLTQMDKKLMRRFDKLEEIKPEQMKYEYNG